MRFCESREKRVAISAQHTKKPTAKVRLWLSRKN
jgi:hypothetical protein